MLKIGDFSKLSRISIRMLRHYDEIGLLIPDSTDDFTSYRYYSEAQLPLANRINALKDMGFGLALIAEILEECKDAQAYKKHLMLKRTEIQEQAESTAKRLLLLETAINRLGKDDHVMKHTVNLKEMPQRFVASLRDIIPSYDMEGTLWHQMMTELEPQKLQFDAPCYSIAIFHDKSYKESDVDVEIQMSVHGNYADTAHVKFKTIAPIQIASVTYQGGYEQIGEVNECIANWIKDNHYEFDGAMFNIYHVGPATEKNPNNWVTEVCYPVKKI
ncbi:MerR family transcriptional regulator [Oscillospiraceae bacterium PP1C4]